MQSVHLHTGQIYCDTISEKQQYNCLHILPVINDIPKNKTSIKDNTMIKPAVSQHLPSVKIMSYSESRSSWSCTYRLSKE